MNDPFDVQIEPNKEAIQALVDQATELVNLENEIACCEQYLKSISGRANMLKTQVIPDKMSELGLMEFRMEDGSRIKVEQYTVGSLPKEPAQKESALQFLEEQGAEGIIKSAVTMEFDKTRHNEALAIADELRSKGFPVDVNSTVNHMTYAAALREMIRNGVAVDQQRMGIFIGRRAKVVGK